MLFPDATLWRRNDAMTVILLFLAASLLIVYQSFWLPLMQIADNATTSLIVLYLFLATNAATHRLISRKNSLTNIFWTCASRCQGSWR